ncbi:hypothetical protein [Chryseobacterium gambrini]|uniref:hypothetical protein n=1 Tax=Chryseobacterium gambrini TaxID=373672 RepID=UPI0022F1D615|nr:hypothetical protein [Chryseobacterium gambrini]WBV53973.1 hypothetical protein PFY09_06520 [Chryseobacterium gambrini]
MCTPNTELQFCTCAEGNINDIKDIYIWSLYRYHGSRESLIRGKVMMPVKDFENGISAEHMTSKLNHGNIFDFDYTPQERDTIHISFNAKNRAEYKYFTLIFRDGVWQEGRNPLFVSIEKNIAKGEVKVLYKENEFLKHCENLKSQYGIEIPESVKVTCANLKDDSQDPIYSAIKNFKEYKIFYRQEFIEYIVKTYFKIYPDENSDRLQAMIDSAQNKFSILEEKFISETENFAFLNRCFKDLDKNIEKCFFITIPFQNKETHLFINSNLIGRTGFKSNRNNRYFKNKSQKIRFEDFELFKDY